MEFARLTEANDKRFLKCMTYYRMSFPYNEQREDEDQKNLLQNKAYHFELLTEAGQEIGAILFWEAEDFMYVEHFFMYPEVRQNGYGSKAIRKLCEKGKKVILEIEPPVDELTIRRKGFYERNGFHLNDYPYTHPPYHAGMEEYELVIMSCPEKLEEEEFRKFCRYVREKTGILYE